jgi:hypothetical protein
VVGSTPLRLGRRDDHPPDFRVYYWNSIQSSYTTAELQSILDRSQLQGCQIVEDFMDVMIVGEA